MILKEVQRIMLSEKAKSRAQQRFFGMVRAAQKGELENPSPEVADVAGEISKKDAKDFAKTKHKGLPEKKKIEEVAFLAAAGKAALAAGKGAIKQKAKQVIKQKAANVAAGAIPQPNRGQQMESKGTAELAGLALRGKKRCAECGSFTHVTGDCPKKDHPVTESNKYKGVLANPMKEVTKESVLTRLGRKKKVEDKKPEKAMDAGARAKRLLQRRIHAKYVSGSEDLVPDDIRDHYEVSEDNYRGTGEKVQKRTLAWMRKKGMKGAPGINAMKEREAEHKAKRGVKKEEVELDERLGGKGYKPYTSLTGKKVSGDWEDSDRGAGNKAKKRAGGTVKAKSPTYIAHVVNKGKKKIDPNKNPVVEAKVDKGRSDYGKATIRNWRHSGPDTVEPAMFDPENKRGKTIDKRRAEHKARRGVKGAKVPTYTKEEKIEEGNWVQKKWQQFVPPPSKSANPNVRSGKLQPGKLEAPGLRLMNNTARTINQPIKNVSKIAKGAKSTIDSAVPAVKAAVGPVAAGLAVSKGVDSLMKVGKKKEVAKEELKIVDKILQEYLPETYFDKNRRGISTKGGFVKQYNKPGKLSRASLNHERKSKNPELRMSKKELRTSMIDDANYEKKMGRSKPTPSNLKTALKKQSANEGVVLEKKKQPSVHDDYYDPMEDPYFDPHEAEATRGQSGRGTKGKMNVRKKYPVK